MYAQWAWVKRFIDISAALCGIVILAPLLLVFAVLIKLDSPGPVFYRGQRVGRHGKIFRISKFRSMVSNAAANQPESVATYSDPRVTRLGVFLRSTKLDELPQLINVLRGEMSLVGPRPEGIKYVPYFTADQRRVLNAWPGITGISQLEFIDESALLRDGRDYERVYVEQILPRKLALDLWYIDHWSLRLDIQCIARTAWQVLSGIFNRGFSIKRNRP